MYGQQVEDSPEIKLLIVMDYTYREEKEEEERKRKRGRGKGREEKIKRGREIQTNALKILSIGIIRYFVFVTKPTFPYMHAHMHKDSWLPTSQTMASCQATCTCS